MTRALNLWLMLILDGLVWSLLFLGPLLVLQRGLQRELQALLLILTRRLDIALALFSLAFLPGVLLHEVSHYLTARILMVRTGRFSLWPRPLPNGRLQLGFVETAHTDILRDALIGAAPLISGGLFVAYAGMVRLGLAGVLTAMAEGSAEGLGVMLAELPSKPDFWLWFYLSFAVSGTMLPSASDRRAWLPVVLVAALLTAISLVSGAGPWLAAHLAKPLNQALRAVAAVLAVSAGLHLVLILPTYGLRRLASRLTGYQVI